MVWVPAPFNVFEEPALCHTSIVAAAKIVKNPRTAKTAKATLAELLKLVELSQAVGPLPDAQPNSKQAERRYRAGSGRAGCDRRGHRIPQRRRFGFVSR